MIPDSFDVVLLDTSVDTEKAIKTTLEYDINTSTCDGARALNSEDTIFRNLGIDTAIFFSIIVLCFSLCCFLLTC